MSFKDKLRRAAISTSAFIDKAKPIVQDAYNVVSVINSSSSPFQKTMGAVSFASTMNHRFLGNLLNSKKHHKEIQYLNSRSITSDIHDFFDRKKVLEKKTDTATFRPDSYGYCDYYIGDFYGADLIFAKPANRGSGESSKIIAPSHLSDEQVHALVSRKLWDLMDDALFYTMDTFSSYKDTVCSNYVVSDEANRLEADIKNAVEKKISRSILLCGPPGSGKSELANYLTTKLFKRRLYIDNTTGPETVQNLLLHLSPDCVVLNDFSVVSSLRQLLPVLEVLKKYVPIVIMTSNSTEELPGALLRPGRIDEVIRLDKMHGPAMIQLVKEILGTLYTEDIFAEIKEWPIAFVQELKARSDLGRDVKKEIEDLKARLLHNDENNDTRSYGSERIFAEAPEPAPEFRVNSRL